MSVRLSIAAEAGAFADAVRIVVFNAPADFDIGSTNSTELTLIQDFKPDVDALTARGFDVVQLPPEQSFDVAVVCLPRAKNFAKDLIAKASAAASRVVVDGSKTDGIEALLKEIKKAVPVKGVLSKAHGKVFWFSNGTFPNWHAEAQLVEKTWKTVAGVFSADAVDPGSAALVRALPGRMSGRVADLGAGWGFVAANALQRFETINELHLVEAQGRALDCAKANVNDPRAVFHWADVSTWGATKNFDAVLMNPPFHSGRKADQNLGRAFIARAAHLLRSRGTLWMVANRHLGYEDTLRELFADVAEIGGTSGFKVIEARKRR